MECNEKDRTVIEKVKFYKSNEIQAHVLIIPKPKFKNGLFVSDLEEGKFFWFIELDSSIPRRLFLYEIYDVMDYEPEVKK